MWIAEAAYLGPPGKRDYASHLIIATHDPSYRMKDELGYACLEEFQKAASM